MIDFVIIFPIPCTEYLALVGMMIQRLKSYIHVPLLFISSFQVQAQQTQAQLTQTMKNLEIQYDSLSHRLIQENTAISLTEQLMYQDNTIDTNDIQYLCNLPAPRTLSSLHNMTKQYLADCDQYIDTIIENQVINSEILSLKNKVQNFRDEIEPLFALYIQQDKKTSSLIDQLAIMLAHTTTKDEQIELLRSHEWCYELELYKQISLQTQLMEDILSKEFFAEGVVNTPDIKELFSTQKDYYEQFYKRVGDFLMVAPAQK